MSLGNYNPGLKMLSRGAGHALAGLSHVHNGLGNPLPFELSLPNIPPPTNMPTPGSPVPNNTTAPTGAGFNWQNLINQGFDFAKTVFVPRGTVIRTPQGTIVRQSDGTQAPVGYNLVQSDTNVNAGAGFGLAATQGISTGAILVLGLGAVVLLVVLRGGGRR